MKKILFSLLLIIGLAVNSSAQTCLDSNTSPGSIVCAGTNLLWTTVSLGANVGDPITWTITGDTTGGATFVASGSNVYNTIVNAVTPNLNSTLVHMGPNAGTVTVQMLFTNNPNPNSCSSSGIAKTLSVTGTATPLVCPSDTSTITAVGVTHFPIPPGDLHLTYTYTLNPGGVSNNTGIFPGLAPGNYTVTITDGECTSAASPVIHIAAVDPRPLITHCPDNINDSFCGYADQAAVDAAFKTWMESFSYEGGFPPVITTTNPAGPVAPSICGGSTTITWTVRDACNLEEQCTATFAIRVPVAPRVTPGEDAHLDACLSQGDIDVAFAAFRNSVSAIGDCGPINVIADPAIAPDRCLGGDVPVTFRINSACFDPIVIVKHFVVAGAVAPSIDTCPAPRDLGCNPVGLPDPETPVVTSLCPYQTEVTDGPVLGEPCAKSQIRTYRVYTDCFPNGVTCTQTFTWKESTGPVLECKANKTAACGAEITFDPPTVVGGCAEVVLSAPVITVVDNVHTATWTATDACGITSAPCSQVVTQEPCAEFNGCTLGYWKNHTLAWCDTYKTCTLYGDVFTGAPANLANLTLLQVLNLGGNTSCENLGRQSVAALLNICEGLPFHIPTVGELQTVVNNAFANDQCTAVGAQLDTFNNEGGANHCDVPFSPNNKKDQCANAKGGNATGKVATPATTPTSFKAYPNPFTNVFSINSTNTVDPISISVYDVLGRSVETRTVSPENSDNEFFGGNYPTGMYNLILNQATEQRTLRVIKQ